MMRFAVTEDLCCLTDSGVGVVGAPCVGAARDAQVAAC